MTRTRYPLTIALLCVSSCHEWHQVARPGASGSLEGSPKIARVTRTVGCATPTAECVAGRDTVTLYNPKVQQDSLIGYYDWHHRKRVAMHVSDVISVESRNLDAGRTAGAALGVGALIGVAWVIALMALLGGPSS